MGACGRTAITAIICKLDHIEIRITLSIILPRDWFCAELIPSDWFCSVGPIIDSRLKAISSCLLRCFSTNTPVSLQLSIIELRMIGCAFVLSLVVFDVCLEIVDDCFKIVCSGRFVVDVENLYRCPPSPVPTNVHRGKCLRSVRSARVCRGFLPPQQRLDQRFYPNYRRKSLRYIQHWKILRIGLPVTLMLCDEPLFILFFGIELHSDRCSCCRRRFTLRCYSFVALLIWRSVNVLF